MNEFKKILAEEQKTWRIEYKDNLPSQGVFNHDEDKIFINKDYVDNPRVAFDEYQMIVVLFHEIGHNIFFHKDRKRYIAEKGKVDFEKENELEALKYSITRCLQLIADGKSKIPLVRCVEKICFRILYETDQSYKAALEGLKNTQCWKVALNEYFKLW